MRKRIAGIVLSVVFVLSFFASANAQEDLIDKLKVVSIKSFQVREEKDNIFLDIQVNITNSNDKEIRLSNGTFTFSLSSVYNKDVTKKETGDKGPDCKKPLCCEDAVRSECDAITPKGEVADKKREIGSAKAPFFIPYYKYAEKGKEGKEPLLVREICCQNVDEIYLKPGEEDNILMFHVNIGTSPMKAFENLMHVMKCTGYPGIKTPHINIEGRFDLGVRSAKGWSSAESVRIEWEFVPKIQSNVEFYTAAE
ncbi:MAG: hypothetical protein BWK80_06660 [Desulfobacteraceae bacterium IS3]|nr:MAG: hypothetical protein BWK80_06660 [Desulfobacteraceae bacterium IS3]